MVVPESRRLRQHLADDVAVHVGQAAFDAVVIEREPLVVEAEKVQEGGMEVVHRGDVFDRLVPELVGGAPIL